MKRIFFFVLFVISFTVGCKDSISTNNNNEIVLQTVNNSFAKTDSIKILIENKTYSDFEVFLKCGGFLEMYYQKKENNAWSNYLWFSWMSLKCLSTIEKIKGYSVFQYTIPINEITENGTYRLALANDTTIVSNSFEVK
ncbi:MAG: hypothetical protein KKG93_05225 [Bacteroidetes bacterium]|nr:hypothetical protein [Bacteroidota bacterium]